LVLTGEGKFFSNGLDLDWLGGEGRSEASEMFDAFYRFLARLLTFPGATVAAVNGHAFGAGPVMCGATDFRVMREDRGFFCFPEVDLGMAMSDGFDAIIQATYPSRPPLRALLTGRRDTGPEAVVEGLVDA